jgi:hypothetical protein
MSRLDADTILTTTLKHTNGTTAATIDSSGRFFTPNTPYFLATRNGQGDETGGGFMTFGTILANRGSWYNGSTGTATAPVAGLYGFWCKTLTPSDSQIVDLRWYINGATSDNYGAGYSGNWGGHKPMIAHVLLNLNANDTVRVYNINSGTRCCGTHNTFMGWLIG